MQVTHRVVDGRYVQIVPPAELTRILREQGEDLSPPPGFGPEDEWDVEEPEYDEES